MKDCMNISNTCQHHLFKMRIEPWRGQNQLMYKAPFGHKLSPLREEIQRWEGGLGEMSEKWRRNTLWAPPLHAPKLSTSSSSMVTWLCFPWTACLYPTQHIAGASSVLTPLTREWWREVTAKSSADLLNFCLIMDVTPVTGERQCFWIEKNHSLRSSCLITKLLHPTISHFFVSQTLKDRTRNRQIKTRAQACFTKGKHWHLWNAVMNRATF